MILLIDNYDSFVYNLARYFAELGCGTEVVRNDAITVDEIRERQPQVIVLSPGPGTPRQGGVCLDVVRELAVEIPILGVCLGHQAIAEAYGANIIPASEPMHGRTSLIDHDRSPMFEGLPHPLTATRYHSLIVEEASLPAELVVTARCREGVVMAIQHRQWPLVGVQFHPESALTLGGHRLLGNFLTIAGIDWSATTSDEFRPCPQDDDFFSQQVLRDHPYPQGHLLETDRSPGDAG